MSLTSCLKKLGKNVSAADRAAIQQLAGDHRKSGKSNQEAALAAVRDHLTALEAEQEAIRGGKVPQEPPKPGGEGEPAQASTARAAADVAKMNPDLMVHLDGMDAPMRVGDLLERVKAEAADDTKLGKLLEVAAACDLRA